MRANKTNKEEKAGGAMTKDNAAQGPKYPKPKVLAINVEGEAVESLQNAGWNVAAGNCGRPYRVAKGGNFQPVIGRVSLPNYTEQEIIIVDLNRGEVLEHPEGRKRNSDEDLDWFAKCSAGIIDPRPRAMIEVRPAFDRILEAGGVFVVFAEGDWEQEFIWGRINDNGLLRGEPIEASIWDFLSALENVVVENDPGTEITPTKSDPVLGQLVADYLAGGRFSCTLTPCSEWTDNITILALNKFNSPVGLARYYENGAAVIVLPQIARKADFLLRLLAECLPTTAPHLFPHIEKGRWTSKPEYELAKVLEYMTEQEMVRQRATAEIGALHGKIAAERAANGWLHDLIAGTDAQLVEAVKKALKTLGFEKVIDVDVERDKEGKSRREDLQIHDQSMALVVDIKGLGNFPSDADATQSHKHATLRSQERKSFQVQGLTIINHQRYLPPLDRDNAMPFRQEILDFAEEMKVGLMTAWDLYRLTINAARLGWKPEHTRPVLYGIGRIVPVPSHYTHVGAVAHVWSRAVSIQMESGKVRMGDRIAFEMDINFEEQEITSLQVEKKAVEEAKAGVLVGTGTKLARPQLRDRQRVFLVGGN
jgi:hypothetical protein